MANGKTVTVNVDNQQGETFKAEIIETGFENHKGYNLAIKEDGSFILIITFENGRNYESLLNHDIAWE